MDPGSRCRCNEHSKILLEPVVDNADDLNIVMITGYLYPEMTPDRARIGQNRELGMEKNMN